MHVGDGHLGLNAPPFAGVSGSTGVTGATGQTGVTGGWTLSLPIKQTSVSSFKRFLLMRQRAVRSRCATVCRRQRLHRCDGSHRTDGCHRWVDSLTPYQANKRLILQALLVDEATGSTVSMRRCLQALAAPPAGPESPDRRVSQVGGLPHLSTERIEVSSLKVIKLLKQWAARSQRANACRCQRLHWCDGSHWTDRCHRWVDSLTPLCSIGFNAMLVGA